MNEKENKRGKQKLNEKSEEIKETKKSKRFHAELKYRINS